MEKHEPNRKNFLKTHRWILKLLAAFVLLGIDVLMMTLFRRFPEFFFPGYRVVSKAWISFLAWLTSFSRAAVWDIAVLILFLVYLYTLIRTLRKKKSILDWFGRVMLVLAVLGTVTICGWMLNHYAPPLAKELGYEVTGYEKSLLEEACAYYLRNAADAALGMNRDEEGHLIRADFYDTAAKAGSAYVTLSETDPVFKGPSVPVKKLSLAGEYLMYNGIIGMFMPLSGEAGVPASVPAAPLPFTMCHEAAHRAGIASEEEANFAAYLACVDHTDPYFRFSAYYSAFSYCYSSLYAVDPESALAVYHGNDEDPGVALVQKDRRDTADTYQRYESKLKEISDDINDTYLKTFSEESGIQSYGEVTDDLIAWYLVHGRA